MYDAIGVFAGSDETLVACLANHRTLALGNMFNVGDRTPSVATSPTTTRPPRSRW